MWPGSEGRREGIGVAEQIGEDLPHLPFEGEKALRGAKLALHRDGCRAVAQMIEGDIGIENQSFFDSDDVNRSVFFVMISRAKERLLLTCCKQRPRPPFYGRRWDETRVAHREFLTYALEAAKS